MPKSELPKTSGKTRALRVQLDYHKRRGGMYWARWISALLVLTVTLGYSGFVLAGIFLAPKDPAQSVEQRWMKQALSQVSTGGLSRAHAHLEGECHRCHDNAMLVGALGQDAHKFDLDASLQQQTTKCNFCHTVDSHLPADANPSAKNMDDNCVSCHSEHLGSSVDLTHIANAQCTQCHDDLVRTCGVQHFVRSRVSDFSSESHGHVAGEGMNTASSIQFRSLLEDPGRIRFDHAQHLRPGQVEEGQRGGFRHAMLSPQWRGVYSADADGLVNLDCQDCHRPQTNSATVATSTQAELSHFYAPIQFDQHCAGCHQLTFVGQTPDMLPLPHAAPRAEIKRLLSAKLTGGKVSGAIRSRRDQIGTERGETPETSLQDIEINDAVVKVFERCSQCHTDPNDLSEASIATSQTGIRDDTAIPTRWLKFGFFDHGSHRTISECKFCHPIPSSTPPTDRSARSPVANDHNQVMIRGPESCTPCHRDAQETNFQLDTPSARLDKLGFANQRSRASDNCVLCHRYHWHRNHGPAGAPKSPEGAE